MAEKEEGIKFNMVELETAIRTLGYEDAADKLGILPEELRTKMGNASFTVRDLFALRNLLVIDSQSFCKLIGI